MEVLKVALRAKFAVLEAYKDEREEARPTRPRQRNF